jgi:hypothetical protein
MEWAVSGVFLLFFLVFVVGGLAVLNLRACRRDPDAE